MSRTELVLRTQIGALKMQAQVSYGSEIFAIGSCFAERIGGQLAAAKFPIKVNPTGVLFNPASICEAIERIAQCSKVTEQELRPNDPADPRGGFYHYDFHSSLSASTAQETLERINSAIEEAHEALRRAKVVIVTLGTAWIYRTAEDGAVVANCHKQPARTFQRERLSSSAIAEQLKRCIAEHLAGKSVILTLSPIRHIADGLAENGVSKATLRLAIEEVVADAARARAAEGSVAAAAVEYFPAFEMMVDDLRDYRFYERDMVHPAPIATEYIYAKFCEATMERQTLEMMQRVERIVRAAEHRPQNSASQSHRSFCAAQLKAIEQITAEEPQIELQGELNYFRDQLR